MNLGSLQVFRFELKVVIVFEGIREGRRLGMKLG